MNEPTDHERREKARTIKAECERINEEIGIFLKMGFSMGEIGIVMHRDGPDEVVPTMMMENVDDS